MQTQFKGRFNLKNIPHQWIAEYEWWLSLPDVTGDEVPGEEVWPTSLRMQGCAFPSAC